MGKEISCKNPIKTKRKITLVGGFGKRTVYKCGKIDAIKFKGKLRELKGFEY